MRTIETYDINLLNAIQYRLREIEWEIRDRFFGGRIEIRRISRILKKHIRRLQNTDPIFGEYQKLNERLQGAKATPIAAE